MSKDVRELATEITVAWLQAKGQAQLSPKPEAVKEFWELMFKTINNAYKLVE